MNLFSPVTDIALCNTLVSQEAANISILAFHWAVDGCHQFPLRAWSRLNCDLEVAGGPIARGVGGNNGHVLVRTGLDGGPLGNKRYDGVAGRIAGNHLAPKLTVEVDVILILLNL